MKPMKGVLIDIDGVLVVSWEPLPGAAECLVRLREAGIPLQDRHQHLVKDSRADCGSPYRRRHTGRSHRYIDGGFKRGAIPFGALPQDTCASW